MECGGTIWQIYARSDIGLLGVTLNELGFTFNYTAEPLHAWLTLLAMDIWHWTSLVALLAFAGLTSVPTACYQAAELDGASKWQVFRYVELPRLKGVLVIAVLLRLRQLHDLYRALRADRRRVPPRFSASIWQPWQWGSLILGLQQRSR